VFGQDSLVRLSFGALWAFSRLVSVRQCFALHCKLLQVSASFGALWVFRVESGRDWLVLGRLGSVSWGMVNSGVERDGGVRDSMGLFRYC